MARMGRWTGVEELTLFEKTVASIAGDTVLIEVLTACEGDSDCVQDHDEGKEISIYLGNLLDLHS